ncbi:MAG TPA: hypothetical protein VFY63_16945, partial [Pseudorhizobium sp.]|nr:hypothetical protein [Pseudorhizobium sp.]
MAAAPRQERNAARLDRGNRPADRRDQTVPPNDGGRDYRRRHWRAHHHRDRRRHSSMKLTPQQKLNALAYRFYQDGTWSPKAGD